ncbi:type IV secretion system protein VirB10 [Burkholderiaceae bacterium UC74_6]
MNSCPHSPDGSNGDRHPLGPDGPYDSHEPSQVSQAGQANIENELHPLPGELGIPDIATQGRSRLSTKALLALVLLAATLIVAAILTGQRMAASLHRTSSSGAALTRDKPSAASTEPHRLDIPEAKPLAGNPASAPLIPALKPIALDDAEEADPIGVHRAQGGAPSATGAKFSPPEDAPVLLVSTRVGSLPPPTSEMTADRRLDLQPSDGLPGAGTSKDPMAATTSNLREYQRRLQGLMDSLTQSAGWAGKEAEVLPASGALLDAEPPMARPPRSPVSITGGLFGEQLQASITPKVSAAMLGDRSLTLPKGTAFTCALKTKVISASSGLIGCVLQRNLYGDDGRVLLVERGSHLDGEYRIASVRPGTVRIPVLWTRLRTPQGVTVDLESPGTGQLGEAGIDGYVDNRWGERIGAALLLSLIDDSVKLIIQNQTNERQGDTIVLPSTTANTSKLAEKVLDSTINIPPLIYQNQGGIVGIYVARDIDFSSVYALEPMERDAKGAVAR